MSNTCDFHTIGPKGKPIHGIAAFLHTAKQHGGVDEYLRKRDHEAKQFATVKAKRELRREAELLK